MAIKAYFEANKELADLLRDDEEDYSGAVKEALWEAVKGLAICDVPHHLVHTVESQVHPNTAPRYFTYTPAVLRQSATQPTGREEADGALVAHGQGVTVTQGSNNLQERYLQVSKGVLVFHLPCRLVYSAESEAHPNAASRVLDCLPAALRQGAMQPMGREGADDSGRAAYGQGVTTVSMSHFPPGLSNTYTTSIREVSAAASGSGTSSASGTTGVGSRPDPAMQAMMEELQAEGQHRFAVTTHPLRWVFRTFVIVNNTDFVVDVHVSSIALIKKLSSAGLSVGSSSVAINAAFEHFRAAERSSWTALPPGQSAPYMLSGGYVSVLSHKDPTLGFFVDHWVRAGRKVSVLGRPLPIRTMAQPAAVAPPAA